MPNSTPVYGITYPCGDEQIDAAALATFAQTLDAALAQGREEVASTANRPNASIRSITNVAVVVNTDTTLTFDSEVYDNDGMAALAVNNDRLTVNTEGVYLVNAGAIITGGFTTITSLAIVILVNGVERVRWKTRKITSFGDVSGQFTVPVDLFAGDFLQLRVRWTGTGGPATLQTRILSASFAAAH